MEDVKWSRQFKRNRVHRETLVFHYTNIVACIHCPFLSSKYPLLMSKIMMIPKGSHECVHPCSYIVLDAYIYISLFYISTECMKEICFSVSELSKVSPALYSPPRKSIKNLLSHHGEVKESTTHWSESSWKEGNGNTHEAVEPCYPHQKRNEKGELWNRPGWWVNDRRDFFL